MPRPNSREGAPGGLRPMTFTPRLASATCKHDEVEQSPGGDLYKGQDAGSGVLYPELTREICVARRSQMPTVPGCLPPQGRLRSPSRWAGPMGRVRMGADPQPVPDFASPPPLLLLGVWDGLSLGCVEF